MIIGVIKTHDVFLHPFLIISMQGVRGFATLVCRALSRKQYLFINSLQNSLQGPIGICGETMGK